MKSKIFFIKISLCPLVFWKKWGSFIQPNFFHLNKFEIQLLIKLSINFLILRSEELQYKEVLSIHTALLRSPEAEKKSFLGNYSARSIKEVSSIIKIYKKNFLHLASMCRFINTQHTISIPYIKDSIRSIESRLIG